MIIWGDQPCHYRLYPNETHVFRAELNIPSKYIEQLASMLSRDEHQRAERFFFDGHRKKYIISRGLLRVLLGCYTDNRPDRIDFIYGQKGKPFLNWKTQDKNIFFNLSHSREVVLFAFSGCPWVGIDVEYIKKTMSVDEIAMRYFHPNENRMLKRLAKEHRKKAFYELWACKEAYLKATGEGLAGLEQVEILPADGDRFSIKRHDMNNNAQIAWFLCQLEPKPAYPGALVIKGSNWNLKFYTIQHEALMRSSALSQERSPATLIY